MSIAAYYARLSRTDLEVLNVNPDHFWQIGLMLSPQVASTTTEISELLSLDKEWLTLSWLCSELGRAEAQYEAALSRVDLSKLTKENLKPMLTQASSEMGFEFVDPKTFPPDLVLTAIQGERDSDVRSDFSNLELGLSTALFEPDEVEKLLSALDGLEESWLRERFSAKEMKLLDLPGDWSDAELDEFILPQLEQLKTLYRRASSMKQYVIVVMS